MDFGIAKAPSEEKLTRVGQVMGTMGALAADLATALRATSGEPAVSSTAPKPVVPLKLVFPDGREQQLHPGVLRLGRAPDNDVIFNDDRVSRYHAEIRCKAQHGCAILDLGSANGTHIDGRVLRPQAFLPLKPGMCVNLGPNVALQIQPETTPRRPAEPPAWPSGSLDTTRNGDRRAAGSPSLLANPTLLIAQVATRLDDRQIALGVVGLLILAILGVWFGTPLWRVSAFVWYNVPLIGLIGALVYAATRRPWVAAVAHTLTALVGGVALWVRLAIYSERYAALLLGAAGGGLLIRAWLAFLPRIKGKAAAPWREAGWLALMAMLAVAILYGAVNVNELRRAGQWFGAAAIGGLGWFLGDIVHQYLTLRAAGRR